MICHVLKKLKTTFCLTGHVDDGDSCICIKVILIPTSILRRSVEANTHLYIHVSVFLKGCVVIVDVY